jgi:hypothetical protein
VGKGNDAPPGSIGEQAALALSIILIGFLLIDLSCWSDRRR